MKIEEAKQAIKASSKAMTDINAIHSFGHIPCKQAIPVNDVINIIDQIETDNPKPVVPQFVAEWLEWCKTNDVTLLGGISPIDELGSAICNDKRVKSLAASRWAERNQDNFARAWLDGYEIEKEEE